MHDTLTIRYVTGGHLTVTLCQTAGEARETGPYSHSLDKVERSVWNLKDEMHSVLQGDGRRIFWGEGLVETKVLRRRKVGLRGIYSANWAWAWWRQSREEKVNRTRGRSPSQLTQGLAGIRFQDVCDEKSLKIQVCCWKLLTWNMKWCKLHFHITRILRWKKKWNAWRLYDMTYRV